METAKAIATYLVPLLLAGLAALGLFALQKWRKAREEAESAEGHAERDLLAAVGDWLPPVLFSLVTNAEREYGGATGRLKLAAVISQAVALLPDKVKGLVEAEWLAGQAEQALKRARLAWAEDENLVKNAPLPTLFGQRKKEEESHAADHQNLAAQGIEPEPAQPAGDDGAAAGGPAAVD